MLHCEFASDRFIIYIYLAIQYSEASILFSSWQFRCLLAWNARHIDDAVSTGNTRATAISSSDEIDKAALMTMTIDTFISAKHWIPRFLDTIAGWFVCPGIASVEIHYAPQIKKYK